MTDLWKTRDGRIINIAVMDNKHLMNTIRLLIRRKAIDQVLAGVTSTAHDRAQQVMSWLSKSSCDKTVSRMVSEAMKREIFNYEEIDAYVTWATLWAPSVVAQVELRPDVVAEAMDLPGFPMPDYPELREWEEE